MALRGFVDAILSPDTERNSDFICIGESLPAGSAGGAWLAADDQRVGVQRT
jgi:hypothetical protein